MIDRQELEQGIGTLELMLKQNVGDEAVYQKHLEDYPVVFNTLGYKASYAKLRLDLPNDEWLEPDFMLQKQNALFDVFDLKTPQERLIKEATHRDTFYAGIHSYIAQVDNYSDYFDDEAHRELVKQKYGIEVQKHPDRIILGGRDATIDKKELHLLLRRHVGNLTIMTFDDLLSHLKAYHAQFFGASENLSGASVHFGIIIHEHPVKRRKYIFDAGEAANKNRLSVFVDETDSLCMEVVDQDSRAFDVKLHLGADEYRFNNFIYVCGEFGSSDDLSVLQLLINNRVVAQTQIAGRVNIPSSLNMKKYTVGADLRGQNNGNISLAELYAYPRTLQFGERFGLFLYMANKYFEVEELPPP